MSERALDRWVTGGLVLYSLVVASALLLAGVPVVRVDGGLARAADLRSALNTGSVNLTYDDGFYYLKIANAMFMGKVEKSEERLPISLGMRAAIALTAIATLYIGLLPNSFIELVNWALGIAQNPATARLTH